MLINLNTDNNIDGNERLSAYLETQLTDGLSRFSSYITRIEVHLSDENANKEGRDDKRCVLEARLEGLQPIADRKSTRLNSSHVKISYAVFCLKKKRT